MSSIDYFDPYSKDNFISENKIQMYIKTFSIDEKNLLLMLQEQSRATTTALAKWALEVIVKNSIENPSKDHFTILREMLTTLVLSSDMTSKEASKFMDEIKNDKSG